MESKTNYTIIGLFVLVLLTALIGIGVWLVSDNTYRNYEMYYAFMDESVSGLNRESPVKYNGVDVGYVTNISINPRNTKQVILTLKIEGDIPITQSTTATMVSQGLTGLRFIELSVGDIHSPLLKKTDKKFPVIPTTPSLLVRLDQTVGSMLHDFDNISEALQAVLDRSTTASMRNSLTHLETITEELAKHIDTMTQSVKDAQIVLHNTAKISDQFPQLVTLMQDTLKQVHSMSNQMRIASEEIAFVAKQSGSTLQQVNEQVMPDISQLVVTLNQLGEQFGDFLQTIEKQPSVMIRGKQPSRPGPGE